MDFGTFIEQVIVTTKRPDRLQQTKNAINNALLKFTVAASFQADLVEGTVTIDGTIYAQSFSITTEFTRYRRMLYLKRTGQKGYMRMSSPLKIYDECGNTRKDTWYRAGDNIVFNPAALAPSLEYGYFQFPAQLVNNADEHWMLDVMNAAMFNEVCSEVFRGIGETTDANAHQTKANDLFESAKNDLEFGGTVVSE